MNVVREPPTGALGAGAGARSTCDHCVTSCDMLAKQHGSHSPRVDESGFGLQPGGIQHWTSHNSSITRLGQFLKAITDRDDSEMP